ncbi:hypothetical protein MNBD_GAMMA15-2578 [hydrothermal vent metagenome]|uniref:TNase-like domain-containing protein n=1 Tax=hydrothermal vent metagenome TaxID=652676 RepID=A0A3B0YDS5_9ZZZZ
MRCSLKKAPAGAFFVLACSAWSASALALDCGPPAKTETAHVRYVHDGDTLVLDNDRKIRVIGINTPELARKDKPNEPLSIRARDRLRQLLFTSKNRVRLLYGEQRKDRYGRYLANIWSTNNRNLTEQLLAEGLGWHIAITPNIRYLECYQAAEVNARKTKRGVWGNPAWKARKAGKLTLRDTGFQRVLGQVTRINHGGGATWIELDNRLTLKLVDSDRHWFKKLPGPDWKGRQLEVRGWLYQTRGKLRVNVHHPATLTLTKAPAN